MSNKSFVAAMAEALRHELTVDEKVFVVGESVRAGSFGLTNDMVHTFGKDRILDAPIAETGVMGAGIGAALAGYRPVVDLMFADFMYVAGDELFLKCPQWRFLHGGKTTMPLTIVAAVGGGLKLANEHSQAPMAPLLHNPGIKLVYPSTPYDAKGLFTTAIRDDNPVFFMWHKLMMMSEGEAPDESYEIPFGVADIKREGADVTVVACGFMVHYALAVAAELEGQIDVEIIDPRTYEPFDLDTVLKSVEKTGRLVIMDEDTEKCGFAGELGFQVMEHAFDSLDAPIKRVCAKNYPIPGGYIEEQIIPNAAWLKTAIQELME